MENMTIPDNKTCIDCIHYRRCKGMFGAKPENRECDFYPVRFEQKEINEIEKDLEEF